METLTKKDLELQRAIENRCKKFGVKYEKDLWEIIISCDIENSDDNQILFEMIVNDLGMVYKKLYEIVDYDDNYKVLDKMDLEDVDYSDMIRFLEKKHSVNAADFQDLTYIGLIDYIDYLKAFYIN
jgi:hypothetical protein